MTDRKILEEKTLDSNIIKGFYIIMGAYIGIAEGGRYFGDVGSVVGGLTLSSLTTYLLFKNSFRKKEQY